MLKKSFFLLLCLAIVLTCLAACGETTAHKHEYSTDWSSNETSHWYAATCEHTDMKANIGAHVDVANDGVCDTCNYGSDHTHTFESEWDSDATNHWHSTTCGHTVKGEEAAHVDSNNDGVCEVCEYGKDHIHIFGTDWTSDKDAHWHAPSCGHTVEVKDKANHTDSDNDGACDVCAYNGGHEHTFETTWSTDGSNHWYAATCDHSVEKDKAAHVDANNDGACDTCRYDGGHKHAYSDEWSYDASAHWNPASCGHTVAGINKAAHADNDGDKACDTCGYTNHSHTFNLSTWVFDSATHWHAATCGCAVKTNDAAHVDANEDGKCDICPYVDTLEHALAIGSSEASKNMVAGGNIVQTNPYSSSRVTYVYGTDYVYLKNEYLQNIYDENWENIIDRVWTIENEEWYTMINDEILALQMTDSGLIKNNYLEPAYLDGPYIYGLVQSSVSGYGVENTLLALYDYATTTTFGIVESGFDYNTKTWSFTFYEASWVYGKITVSFTVDEHNVIDYVTINERFYDQYTVDEDGVYSATESEYDNVYTTTINQVLGGRVLSFPFNMEDFYVTDIEFTDYEGNELGDELTTDVGLYNEFVITVVAPEDANLSIDIPEVTVYDADGFVSYDAYAGYSSWDGNVFYFTIYQEGTFTVEFKLQKVTKTITVTAAMPETLYIEPAVPGDYGLVSIDTATAYVGMPFYFSAIANEYADASFTAILSRQDMMVCTLEEAVFDVNYDPYSGYKFVATQAGVYRVLLTSVANPELTAVLTIEVVEAPKMSDILNGTWEGVQRGGWSSKTVTVVFTPESEGALSGTVVVTETSSGWENTVSSATYTYVFDEELGSAVLTFVEGDSLYVDELRVNSDFTISTYYNGFEQLALEQLGGDSGADASVVDGTWNEMDGNFSLVLDAETMTGQFIYGDSIVAFTFTAEEGLIYGNPALVLSFTEDPDNSVNPDAASVFFDAEVASGNNQYGDQTWYDSNYDELFFVYVHPMMCIYGTWLVR